MKNLPVGAWQGALLAVVGGIVQSVTHGESISAIHVGTWTILGAAIGIAVAKLWAKRRGKPPYL